VAGAVLLQHAALMCILIRQQQQAAAGRCCLTVQQGFRVSCALVCCGMLIVALCLQLLAALQWQCLLQCLPYGWVASV